MVDQGEEGIYLEAPLSARNSRMIREARSCRPHPDDPAGFLEEKHYKNENIDRSSLSGPEPIFAECAKCVETTAAQSP